MRFSKVRMEQRILSKNGSMSHVPSWICFVLVIDFVMTCEAKSPGLATIFHKVSAFFVFGDSVVDSGNDVYLNISLNAACMPYGYDMPNKASGRFSNGHTIADLLGMKLNLSESFPFWVVFRDSGSKVNAGFNYATASAGILLDTGKQYGETFSLKNQIDLFEKTVREYLPLHFHTESETGEYVDDSLFLIAIGSNDLLEAYEKSPYLTNTDMAEVANLLVQDLKSSLNKLYNLGGRKFLVFEVGPLGCYPLVLDPNDNANDGGCRVKLNELVSIFNCKLYQMLANMSFHLERTTLVLGNTYKLIYEMVAYPQRHSLEYSKIPCCIVSSPGERVCACDKEPCGRRDLHVFWDNFHLSAKANHIVVNKCFTDYEVCLPIITYLLDDEICVDDTGQHGHQPNLIFCILSFLLQAIIAISFI